MHTTQGEKMTSDYVLDEEKFKYHAKTWEVKGRHAIYVSIIDNVLANYDHPVSVSDVGCGIALLSNIINSDGVSYVGYDINPLSIAECNKRFPDKTFVQQDVRKYCDNVDIVMAFAFLKHFSLEEIPAIINILGKCSKQLIFSLPIGEDKDDFSNGWPHTFMSRETLDKALKKAGHQVVYVNDNDVEQIFVTERIDEAKVEDSKVTTVSEATTTIKSPAKKARKKKSRKK
jgi:hypothetical protein